MRRSTPQRRTILAAAAATASLVIASGCGQDEEAEAAQPPTASNEVAAADSAAEATEASDTSPAAEPDEPDEADEATESDEADDSSDASGAPEDADPDGSTGGTPPILELGVNQIGEVTLPADPAEVRDHLTEVWGAPDVDEVRQGCPGQYVDPDLQIMQWGDLTVYGQAEDGDPIQITGWEVGSEPAAGPYELEGDLYPLDPWSEAEDYAAEMGYDIQDYFEGFRVMSDEPFQQWTTGAEAEVIESVGFQVITCH